MKEATKCLICINVYSNKIGRILAKLALIYNSILLDRDRASDRPLYLVILKFALEINASYSDKIKKRN